MRNIRASLATLMISFPSAALGRGQCVLFLADERLESLGLRAAQRLISVKFIAAVVATALLSAGHYLIYHLPFASSTRHLLCAARRVTSLLRSR